MFFGVLGPTPHPPRIPDFNFLDGKRHGGDLSPRESVISPRAGAAGPSERVRACVLSFWQTWLEASGPLISFCMLQPIALPPLATEAHCNAGDDAEHGSPQTAGFGQGVGEKPVCRQNVKFCSQNAADCRLFLTSCALYFCYSHYFLS